jgi:predicted PurR-regulated permease PerM
MAFHRHHLPASAKDQLFAASALLVTSVILYYGRTLLIPMLLAVLLSFVLTPFVHYLQKRGVHRILSVVMVMTVALTVIGMLLLAVFSQLNTLVQELPAKKNHIITKISDLSGDGPSMLGTLTRFLEDINRDVQEKSEPREPGATGSSNQLPPEKPGAGQDQKPVPVIIERSPSTWLNLPTVATSIQHALGFTLLTISLCASMLIKREDLRNRLITLIGQGHVTSTTKAMEEATRRMSSYLLSQLVLNSAFGILFGLGLWIIGVDYAFIWGLLATILRFIPGLGTWMAAVIPLIASLAVEGWWTPILVICWTVLLGIAFNYIVEPVIVSRRTGLSMVSLVVVAAFWTWLWGLPGLVLATPISVCLLVLGSHIPAFHFLYVLLAEDTVLDTDLSFYQRLLADDVDEATYVLETYLESHNEQEMAEEIIIPALALAQADVQNELITQDDLTRILTHMEKAIEHVMSLGTDELAKADDPGDGRALLLSCATHDQRETLALHVMKAMLPTTAGRMEVIGDRATVSEIIQHIQEKQPTMVCLVTIPPRGYNQPRMRCKRLRALFPDLPIVVAMWGMPADMDKNEHLLYGAGATHVTWSFKETLDIVFPKLRLASHQRENETKSELPGEAPNEKVNAISAGQLSGTA